MEDFPKTQLSVVDIHFTLGDFNSARVGIVTAPQRMIEKKTHLDEQSK